MKVKPWHSLAGFLLRRILLWAVLCALVLSAVHTWQNLYALERNFDLVIDDTAHTHLPLLSVAIWDIEPQAVHKQMRAMLRNPSIAQVQIRADTGKEFKLGTSQVENGKTYAYNIAVPNDESKRLGQLVLTVERKVLRQEWLRNFSITLMMALALCTVIFVAIAVILHKHLEVPMRTLADFVKHLHTNQPGKNIDLKLQAKHSQTEIGFVVEGLYQMQDSLRLHIEHQDALVLKRTQQLEKAMQTLKQLSITDNLTGCYNRLYFNERMPGEVQRANRYAHALTVLFCDIDFFKAVNDQHGHAAGDQVLIAFAQCLQLELRSDVDWLVRFGGEEFLVVLPETGLLDALEVAARMRRRIEEACVIEIADKQNLHVTASFGVAEKNSLDNIESLLKRADDWLYHAKSNGRNQVQPQAASKQTKLFSA